MCQELDSTLQAHFSERPQFRQRWGRILGKEFPDGYVIAWTVDGFAINQLTVPPAKHAERVRLNRTRKQPFLHTVDPAGLHRLGTLAEATRELASITPHASKLLRRPKPAPFEAVLVQLALTRGAYDAYAVERGSPLARWFQLARKQGPETPAGIARLLSRDVHPAIGALAASWESDIARAA